jgi:SAM-dependent methyltransferase
MPAQQFDDPYQAKPFWDIGRPQQAYVKRFSAAPPQSPILEIGCGSGDLVIYVASLGCNVLGIDLSPIAIAQATAKARTANSKAAFMVHDIFSQPGLERSFKTILDCCFFHTLADPLRAQYAQRLRGLLEPNGLIYMLCHADPIALGRRAVTRETLARVFADGWSILGVDSCVIEAALIPAGRGMPGIFACLKKESSVQEALVTQKILDSLE